MTFSNQEMELTYILVVSNLERSKQFCINILGAEFYREYGGSSCVVRYGHLLEIKWLKWLDGRCFLVNNTHEQSICCNGGFS
jgi:hypothetical protein